MSQSKFISIIKEQNIVLLLLCRMNAQIWSMAVDAVNQKTPFKTSAPKTKTTLRLDSSKKQVRGEVLVCLPSLSFFCQGINCCSFSMVRPYQTYHVGYSVIGFKCQLHEFLRRLKSPLNIIKLSIIKTTIRSGYEMTCWRTFNVRGFFCQSFSGRNQNDKMIYTYVYMLGRQFSFKGCPSERLKLSEYSVFSLIFGLIFGCFLKKAMERVWLSNLLCQRLDIALLIIVLYHFIAATNIHLLRNEVSNHHQKIVLVPSK